MSRSALNTSIDTVFNNAVADNSLTPAIVGAELKKVADYADQQDILKVDKVSGERLINAAEITKLTNVSGTNTGDQDLSGKVDKVTGKSLINDTEITRLAGITNVVKTTGSVEAVAGSKATLQYDINNVNKSGGAEVKLPTTTEIGKEVLFFATSFSGTVSVYVNDTEDIKLSGGSNGISGNQQSLQISANEAYRFTYRTSGFWFYEKIFDIPTNLYQLQSERTTDVTLATNSNFKYPTERAVKTYVDTNVGSSVNTAFTTKTYLATMSVAHNTSSPNFKIDVTGNLSLTITGTVNGDSGIVNLYFTAAQVATLNGFANLVITGSGAMIPVYFIHDNDGIKWYKDEVGGAAVDTSLFALQDGTILYHTVKTFVTTATISTVGTAVTISTSQFQSFASVGLKLTINGESRIITAFTDGFNVTVNSAYSTNYVSQPSSAWGIYSAFLRYRPSDSAVFIKNSSGFDTASFYNNNVVAVSNTIESLNNSYQLSNEGLKLRSDGFIRTSSTSNANGTSDIGLRRNSAGVYEIYNGVTNTGLDADRRDLLVRNLVSKSNIYANDAAADADTALPSGAFYKITGSRVVYQKA